MRKALGVFVGLFPVWAILVWSGFALQWFVPFVVLAGVGVVVGFTFLGMWIGGEL